LRCSFQRKQYADIEIVQTEKKGFGLRAERAFHKYVGCSRLHVRRFNRLLRDTFIYEYVGDVVNPASFKKRMRAYADEGIRHFYFMMLQKDEVRALHGC
jgi:histone-lysine N-methyltransferase SETD2